MDIGIPKELKTLEGRVALIPEACGELVHQGHTVRVETMAGELSGYSDQDYLAVGAHISPTADALYADSKLIVKVKEPVKAEYHRLQPHHLLFCYLHLAALPELTQTLQNIGLTAIGFETVEVDGQLPLLASMSSVAGRLSVQSGTTLLHSPQQGKGILLGGLGSVDRGNVVILGAGVAGSQAAVVAAQLGANVTIFDKKLDKLTEMHNLGPNVTALYPYQEALHNAVVNADLLIGAVLIPGAKAPKLVTEAWVKEMQPGSVIMDIAIDQGGCIETMSPTTYQEPTYQCHEVTHFAVTNMPGGVPKTSSQALCAAITPYVLQLAAGNLTSSPALTSGINVDRGNIVHPALIRNS